MAASKKWHFPLFIPLKKREKKTNKQTNKQTKKIQEKTDKSESPQRSRFFHFFANFRLFFHTFLKVYNTQRNQKCNFLLYQLHFAMVNNSFIIKTSQIKTMKKRLENFRNTSRKLHALKYIFKNNRHSKNRNIRIEDLDQYHARE